MASRQFTHKTNVEVDLVLHNGENLSGFIFVETGQRVLDLLNESTPFFPIRTDDDEVLLVSKAAIAVCKPLDSPG